MIQNGNDPGAENMSATDNSQNTDTIAAGGLACEQPPIKSYEGWQAKYDALLFDGTYSSKSYLRLWENDSLEIGVQPRLHRASQNLLVFGCRLRVSFKDGGKIKGNDETVQNPDQGSGEFNVDDQPQTESGTRGTAEPGAVIEFPMLKPGARSARVGELLSAIPNASFNRVDFNRASVNFAIPLPFTIAQGAAFNTAIKDTTLCRDLFKIVIQPDGGWDEDLLASAGDALSEYFQVCADQFELFVEPIAPLPVVDFYPEKVQLFLSTLSEKAASATAEPQASTL